MCLLYGVIYSDLTVYRPTGDVIYEARNWRQKLLFFYHIQQVRFSEIVWKPSGDAQKIVSLILKI